MRSFVIAAAALALASLASTPARACHRGRHKAAGVACVAAAPSGPFQTGYAVTARVRARHGHGHCR